LPLALLAGPLSERGRPVSAQTSRQFIQATASTIIASVAGYAHLGPQPEELLELIERFGDQDSASLQSAVYELEDPDAPPAKRSARGRLRQFPSQPPERGQGRRYRRAHQVPGVQGP
jgi:hypothetical protein